MNACPRCAGFLYQDFDFPKCLNCGHRVIEPFVERLPIRLFCLDCQKPPKDGYARCHEHLQQQAALRRCVECGNEPRIAGRTLGRRCHGAHIKRGVAAGRSIG